MKLSFWTLGMPKWDTSELAHKAAGYGYAGVDLSIRNRESVARNPFDVTLASSDADVERIRDTFRSAGVVIPSLMCEPAGDFTAVWGQEDVSIAAQLTRHIGAPQFRAWVGNPPPGTSWMDHFETLWNTLAIALDAAPGVRAMVENHTGSANARQLLEACTHFGDDRIGVELSPDHTLTMQEDVLDLVEQYSRHIIQVCFADRRVVQEDLARFDGRYYYVRYEAVPPGDGDVPSKKLFTALEARGFDGYVSLKLEKGRLKNGGLMGENLPEADVALPMFENWMKSLGVTVG